MDFFHPSASTAKIMFSLIGLRGLRAAHFSLLLELRQPFSTSYILGSSKILDDKVKQKIQHAESEKLKKQPEWMKRTQAVKKKYGNWNPTRKISYQQMQDIRDLKVKAPHLRTIDLANHFKMSPEAIRRILRSNWIPNDEELDRKIRTAEKRKQEAKGKKQESKSRRGNNLKSKFMVDGKIMYDSDKSHGFYNKNKPKESNKGYKAKKGYKPYVETVGDLID